MKPGRFQAGFEQTRALSSRVRANQGAFRLGVKLHHCPTGRMAWFTKRAMKVYSAVFDSVADTPVYGCKLSDTKKKNKRGFSSCVKFQSKFYLQSGLKI